MRKILFVACGLAVVAVLLVPTVASAQYVTPPGHGPTVGGTDTGRDLGNQSNEVVTNDQGTPPADNPTGPPTEVKGKQFARDISSSHSGFKLLWLWLLMALALGLLFLVLWRRRREDEDEDFSGAQPA